VAAIMKWGVVSSDLRWVGTTAVILLCMMAILFCELWVAQIRDFKRLNDAKFEVLNGMAPSIVFNPTPQDLRRSYRPFEREWEKLKHKGAVNNVRTLNILALKSSHMEQFIPRAFQFIFAAAIIAVFVLAINVQPSLTPSSVKVAQVRKVS
jgi:hypothetical protein